MTKINGIRFGKRDKKNRIKVLIPGGSKLQINGAECTIKSSTTVFVETHEDANKILGVDLEKTEEVS